MTEKAIMILAVAMVVSSLMLSMAVWTAGNTVGSGLSKVQLNLAAGSGSGSGTAPQLQPTAAPTPQVDYRDLVKSFAGSEGSDSAAVSVVEFSDYQCPFCRRAFEDAVKGIREDYVKTGKVKLYYKDFPLSFHPDAPKAANAARCAGEQGKYFDMHDKIYAGQGPAELGTVAINASVYFTYAKELKLNEAQFKTCVDSDKYAAQVQTDLNQGIAAGVSGTPTFFVNNQQIVGAQPYAVIKQAIEAELAG